jgi:G3E family GTPase
MNSHATTTPKNTTPAELRRALDTVDFLSGLVEVAALNRTRSDMRRAALPVVVVSGFLGAGKTTLMRHLLTADHGMKIAALVNDFAALNIDAALIANVTGDTTALDNGCICCSLSGGVARALCEISEREELVDAVLVEASGVSDPAGIAHVASAVDGVTLDCIVTVVDAVENTGSTGWDDLLERQVAPANLVLLNKTDLLSAPEVDAITERLVVLAPRAQILRTSHCAVPPVVIFDAASAPALIGTEGDSRQDHGFTTMLFSAAQPIDRFEIEALLNNMPSGILRLKGFVRLAEAPEIAMLLQGVGPRWSWHEAPEAPSGSKLVMIGQTSTMDPDSIQQHFAPLGLKPDLAAD